MKDNSADKDCVMSITIHKFLITFFSCLLIYEYFDPTEPEPGLVRISNPKFSLLGPYNVSLPPTDDDYQQLIDLKNFKYIVNPLPCKEYSEGLLLLVLVASKPSNSRNRMVIRNTWGRSIDSTKVLFLLGESDKMAETNDIRNESSMYGDIILGNFVDAYRNMTYKHVMGLKWIAHHCPTAKYILKADDDVVVNSHELRHFLARELSPWGAHGLITCQVLQNAPVQRSRRSKWQVSTDEYSDRYYPTYCAGWAILYSQDVVQTLLKTAQSMPYFWIDDVHITGICAEKADIARTPLASLVLSLTRANVLTTMGSKYIGPFLFGPPDISLNKISQIWKAIPE